MQPDALDALGIGIDRLEPPARGVKHRFARREDAPREQEGQPADGIDLVLLGNQPRIDRFAQFLELEPGIRLPQSLVESDQEPAGLFVMLVLNLADDLLDHILDRD